MQLCIEVIWPIVMVPYVSSKILPRCYTTVHYVMHLEYLKISEDNIHSRKDVMHLFLYMSHIFFRWCNVLSRNVLLYAD